MLILASGSAARSGLLEKAGIPHSVMVSGVDEDGFGNLDASNLVKTLAFAKANAVALKLFSEEVQSSPQTKINSILGCDSVFVFEDEIYGKPKDSYEAIDRWGRMSSKSGILITGHVLLFKPLSLKCL